MAGASNVASAVRLEIGVNRAVQHHRTHVTREQLPVDRPKHRAIGQSVVVDSVDPKSHAETVHIPSGSRGVDSREQLGITGTTGSIQARKRTGRSQGSGRCAARCGGGWTAEKRVARSGSPFIEAHQGELAPYRCRNERRQNRKDEDPALTWTSRVEHDHPLAVGRRVLNNSQGQRPTGRRVPVVNRHLERTAKEPRRLGAWRPGNARLSQCSVGHTRTRREGERQD